MRVKYFFISVALGVITLAAYELGKSVEAIRHRKELQTVRELYAAKLAAKKTPVSRTEETMSEYVDELDIPEDVVLFSKPEEVVEDDETFNNRFVIVGVEEYEKSAGDDSYEFTFHSSDEVLADESGVPLSNEVDLIGAEASKTLRSLSDGDVMIVRDRHRLRIFHITVSASEFAETVHGRHLMEDDDSEW